MNKRNLLLVAASIAAGMTLLPGCTTNTGATASPAEKRAEIDRGVDSTLATLYSSVKGSRELAAKAAGILVFPKIYAAGLGIGGEYGEGALQVDLRPVDYYKATGLSIGWQAGAQSKALIFMFMTKDALDKFRKSSGWTAGADAAVAVVKVGAQGTIDTASAGQSVNAFALTNAGLMAAVTVDGTKISKLEP
jgi:lipid-binding SYLF domain-containing protein